MTAQLEVIPTTEPRGFRLVGELDLTTTASLEAALQEATRDGAATVTLDLSGLRFMDSMGIRVLLSTARQLDDDTPLVLLRPTGEVKRALEVAGLAEGAPGIRVELDPSSG